MSATRDAAAADAIAVIGLAGRFPDADTIERFWQNLCDGRESVRRFTDEQLDRAGVERSLLRDPAYVKAGVVLEGVELFDAAFFGFTPREAELTDPQHRIFLECAWEALEDAGYDPERDGRRVGVFAGAGLNAYFLHIVASNPSLVGSWSDLQKMLIIDKDYLATRVSYKLNLKGPSITVQTACSTSLVAVHLACQSLLNGECDMALAGGISIRVPQIAGYRYEEGSIASPDGHCRAFDAGAQGMVLGSGAGIVVLKRLEEAISDRDNVRAVIRGSAVNNDGSEKIGYTAPSADAQAAVIAEALALAGVDAEQVTFVETHGTGTQLGDPIEIAGLTRAFRGTTRRSGFCAIGSLKTNIGHLDAAAGVAGLIKTVLAMQHRLLPPSLNFSSPNPNIDFTNSPFYVQRTLSRWDPEGGRRIAGVSSFGIGGTNAHVIIEEAPPRQEAGAARPWQLIVLSARTPVALERATDNLAGFLKAHESADFADVAYTLQVGRKAFVHRRCFAARNASDALQVLQTKDLHRLFTASGGHVGRPIVFMFPGQAAQCVNMGREIYESEEVFRETVDSCSRFLEPRLGFSLLQVLYPPPDKVEEAAEQIGRTSITQPALFVVEYATARLWMQWGMKPEAMIGHSLGEYVAACLAGVFTLEDALELVAARGRLMNGLPTGSMIAVRTSESAVTELLDGHLSLAAVNGPSSCVVSGTPEAITALQGRLTGIGIAFRPLPTSRAFHSAMMEPVLDPFRRIIGGVRLNPPAIPYVSNVTGRWIDAGQSTDPEYWTTHLRRTVRFADGLGELLKDPSRILLEVGPGGTLASFVKQHGLKHPDQVVQSSFGYTRDGLSDLPAMLNALGRLWAVGADADWTAFNAGRPRRRVSLPTYPFERHRYWIEAAASPTIDPSSGASDAAAARDSGAPNYERPDLSSAYAPPQNELEKRLASIWERLLGFDGIGRDDNFFEMGGDSLLATQVVSRIRDDLQVHLTLKRFFESPTVRRLSEAVESLLIEEIEGLSEDEVLRRLRNAG